MRLVADILGKAQPISLGVLDFSLCLQDLLVRLIAGALYTGCNLTISLLAGSHTFTFSWYRATVCVSGTIPKVRARTQRPHCICRLGMLSPHVCSSRAGTAACATAAGRALDCSLAQGCELVRLPKAAESLPAPCNSALLAMLCQALNTLITQS